MSEPHPKVAEMADKLSQATSMAVQMSALLAKKEGANGRIDALYVAAVGVVGGMHVLASLLGHHGDATREEIRPDDLNKLINPTSTLLAGILCHAMAPSASLHGTSPDGNSLMECNISFSPEIVMDAIQQVERITGRPVDGQINANMLRSLRELAEGSEEPMNRFLAQRRGTPGGLH